MAESLADHPDLRGARRPMLHGALEQALRGFAVPVDGSVKAQGDRKPAERRQYAGKPAAYFRDVLGWKLTGQQEEALHLIESLDRLLIPSGNNLGKTFLLGGYGVYRFDAVAALPDEDRGFEEQGCQLLLPGPDHGTVFSTLYAAMLEHAMRAERRGFRMPGERSENSVLWRVRPRWQVEAFSPTKNVAQEVAHTASGRHHRNQVALIEEGQGVEERVWKATEGMCSGDGNKIISSFNPTEARGSAYTRARAGTYRVAHLSAFDHPNVRKRSAIIPDAVSFKVIDDRVRADCRDRGPYPAVKPEKEFYDFVYALPPKDAAETGPRPDRKLGHPAGALRVYRPGPSFTAQVLGRWPKAGDSGLFSAGAIEQSGQRHAQGADPSGIPDNVGVDVAREGADETVTATRFGEDAEALLRSYAMAVQQGDDAVADFCATRRQRIGEFRAYPKGDGPDTAQRIALAYPDSPWAVDEGGVGTSVLDHARRVLGKRAQGVSFAAAAPIPTPGEPWSENMRTAMYVRAARMLDLGLCDAPDDPLLREELLAHHLLYRSRVVTREDGTKERKPTVLLVAKDEVKQKLGRSPDRADAFVLAVNGSGTPPVELLFGRA